MKYRIARGQEFAAIAKLIFNQPISKLPFLA